MKSQIKTIASVICSKKKIYKLISLIVGIFCWHIIGKTLLIARWVELPVYFYNVESGRGVQAPETIAIKLQGSRELFARLTDQQCALHIDASRLAQGPHQINPFSYQLFLPETMKMVDYIGKQFTITDSDAHKVMS